MSGKRPAESGVTVAELDAFVPTGEEHEDVVLLGEITDQLVSNEQVQAAIPAMLRIFERFPHALLGSPGPLVHCIESAGMEMFLPMVLDSFRKNPNRKTLWMMERCLRSNPSIALQRAVLDTLRLVRRSPAASDFHDEIDEDLAEYDSGQ